MSDLEQRVPNPAPATASPHSRGLVNVHFRDHEAGRHRRGAGCGPRLAAPAAANRTGPGWLRDDFTSVDPAQVSFCIEDAQGSVLGGGVSPTAEVLPAVVADPEAVGGWRLAIPEGWAGTAVMGRPPLVAAHCGRGSAAVAGACDDAPCNIALGSRADPLRGGTDAAPRGSPSAESSTTAPLAAAPKPTWPRRTPARRDRAPPGGRRAARSAAAAAAFGLRKRRASDKPKTGGGAGD